ncbi:phosphate transport system regulatory protein PhoU [Alistipes sp. CAG:831]|nr:phosphate transport system regulatory protein PhoU [Alistipes sp. CAG:831]
MVKFVDQQLTQLRNEVYRMWAMVYSQMDQARQAVLAMDRNIAQQIWVRERLVDAQDIKIDTQVEDFIALYTPVAVDLRFVLAMLKINSDLERIGDYAYSIARFVKETDVEKLDADLVGRLQLERMFGVVLEMMNELQASLMDENPAKASSVIDMDDELDRLKTASDSILMEYARTHTDELPVLMGLGSVFRKLERTGDHLTNIAEEIVFYIDAKVLKHTAMLSGKDAQE